MKANRNEFDNELDDALINAPNDIPTDCWLGMRRFDLRCLVICRMDRGVSRPLTIPF